MMLDVVLYLVDLQSLEKLPGLKGGKAGNTNKFLFYKLGRTKQNKSIGHGVPLFLLFSLLLLFVDASGVMREWVSNTLQR